MAALLAASISAQVTDTVESIADWVRGKIAGEIELTSLNNTMCNIPATTTETAFKATL